MGYKHRTDSPLEVLITSGCWLLCPSVINIAATFEIDFGSTQPGCSWSLRALRKDRFSICFPLTQWVNLIWVLCVKHFVITVFDVRLIFYKQWCSSGTSVRKVSELTEILTFDAAACWTPAPVAGVQHLEFVGYSVSVAGVIKCMNITGINE